MALLVVCLGGCRLTGMVFVQTDAIVITTPANLAEVGHPVRVSWQSKLPASKYAVFVDTQPMDVGQRIDGNLDKDHGFETTDTSVELDNLRPGQGVTDRERNHHQVTVVAVDSGGIRQSEESAAVEFTVTP